MGAPGTGASGTGAPEISVATPADRQPIVSSLVAAFPADPVLRYLFPDDATYPEHAAAFFGHLFDKRVHRQSIWTIGGAAVAIWEPPTTSTAAQPAAAQLAAVQPSAIEPSAVKPGSVRSGSVRSSSVQPSAVRSSAGQISAAETATDAIPGPLTGPNLPPDALARMTAYDDAVHSAFPSTPFWYLGVLGTNPAYAGRGWGRAVMRVGLDRAAAEGLPVVLETSKPANVELYRRAGWKVLQELTAPLPIWVMTQ
jgi:ribosomal protein S18 acetylase RimI-like enzyme